jgi:phytanoyl-CoA hydroxylase
MMDWREEYRDKGFIIVDNVLPHALIDAHLRDVAALLRRHGVTDSRSFSMLSPQRDDALMDAMLDVHRRSAITRRLVYQRAVRAILRGLFGAEPTLAIARSALWEPGSMRAHVDTAFHSPDPPYSVCRTWCALEDIHPESGRFYLVPGTHRTITPHLCREVLDQRPELRRLFDEVADEPASWFRLRNRGWSYVSAKVADRIDPRHVVSPRLSKGDVIFFNPAVAHGTLPRGDPSLTRKMMVCEWTTEEVGFAARPAPTFRHRAEPVGDTGNVLDLTKFLARRAIAR